MWPRRELVDQQFAVLREEHLDRDQAHDVEVRGDPGGQFLRSLGDGPVYSGRGDSQVQYPVHVDVLAAREGKRVSVDVAGAHNR